MSERSDRPGRTKVVTKEKLSAADSPMRARPVSMRSYPKHNAVKDIFVNTKNVLIPDETTERVQIERELTKSTPSAIAERAAAERAAAEQAAIARAATEKAAQEQANAAREKAKIAAKQKPKAKAKTKKDKIADLRSQPTIVGPRERSTAPEVTSASKVNRAAKKQAADKSQANATRLALALLLIGLVWLGMNNFGSGGASRQKGSGLTAEQIRMRDRVNYHRTEIGHRLNRERIQVEYQNQQSAPTIPESAKPVAQPDMMAGLPLQPESHHRDNDRDRLQAVDPDYADARIQYTLQEQQSLNDWEKKAQRQYVEEFIANAAREGYKVQVDKNGTVKVIGRVPAQTQPAKPYNGEFGQLPGGPSAPGSVR